MKKGASGMLVYRNKLLVCGGYGVRPASIQPESEWIKSEKFTSGWTNEIHSFDLAEGTWSSPAITGTRPPPCSRFSLTMVDSHRAVLFGGDLPKRRSDDTYMIDLARMHWTRITHDEEEPRPAARAGHAAVCLDCGGDGPQLVITGGVDNGLNVLSDMWMLDIETGKWKELLVPGLQRRDSHCITSFTVGPGVAEITMFGGRPVWPGNAKSVDDFPRLAGTTVLRFEKEVCLSTSGSRAAPDNEWILTSITNKSQQGTCRRMKEKMARLSQLYYKTERSKEEVERSKREVERRLKELEERTRENVRDQVQTTLTRALEAERRLEESEEHARSSAREVQTTLTRALEAERRLEESEDQARRSAREVETALARAMEVERRAQASEQRLREVEERGGEERQWLVGRREIHMTGEGLGGGGWGEVKVAEFRGVRVAAKLLYRDLQSPYYHDVFAREMNMAARVRHPNLVQFIGASMDEEMVILMELMPTNLRQHLTRNAPSAPFTTAVSLDVARALNYLHLMQPDPIIHRDISSANVLLEPLSSQRWRAKVTDYGSVNMMTKLRTENPGSPVYSSPEACIPSRQSPKMDMFSFGVLLLEMSIGQFPEVSARKRMLDSIQEPQWVNLIRQCTHQNKEQRPSADQVIALLMTW